MGFFHKIASVLGDESLDYEKRQAQEAGYREGHQAGEATGYQRGKEAGYQEALSIHTELLHQLEGVAAKLRAGTRIINLTTIGVCLLFLGSIYCGFRPSAKFAKWFALTASTLYMIATVFNTIRNRELRSQMWDLSHAIHGSENRVYLLVCSNISRCMFTIVIAQVLLAVAVNLAESQHNQLKWDLLRFIGQSLTQFYGKF